MDQIECRSAESKRRSAESKRRSVESKCSQVSDSSSDTISDCIRLEGPMLEYARLHSLIEDKTNDTISWGRKAPL